MGNGGVSRECCGASTAGELPQPLWAGVARFLDLWGDTSLPEGEEWVSGDVTASEAASGEEEDLMMVQSGGEDNIPAGHYEDYMKATLPGTEPHTKVPCLHPA